MARIRTVKPEFWSSDQIVECCRDARLLFIGLWNFCDDNGAHPASYKQLRRLVFPDDNCSEQQIADWISELINAGLLIEYTKENKNYWQVTGWRRHQKIDRPTYRYPEPDKQANNSETIRRTVGDCSANGSRTVGEQSETNLLRNGMEGKGIDTCKVSGETSRVPVKTLDSACTQETKPNVNASKPDPSVQAIFDHWREVMGHPQAKLDKTRIAKLKQALQSYSVENLKQAIDGCANTPHNMGKNENKIRYDSIDVIFRNADQIERFMASAKTNNNHDIAGSTHDPIFAGAI